MWRKQNTLNLINAHADLECCGRANERVCFRFIILKHLLPCIGKLNVLNQNYSCVCRIRGRLLCRTRFCADAYAPRRDYRISAITMADFDELVQAVWWRLEVQFQK